jgi:hypothetical protein
VVSNSRRIQYVRSKKYKGAVTPPYSYSFNAIDTHTLYTRNNIILHSTDIGYHIILSKVDGSHMNIIIIPNITQHPSNIFIAP